MLLSEGTTEGNACRYADETNQERGERPAVYELRGGRIFRNANRTCESGLHRHSRDGWTRRVTAAAGLGLFRPRSRFRRICGCGARGAADERRARRAETCIVSKNVGQP